MSTKRPLCNYSGSVEELKTTDFLPLLLPHWKINADEIILVGDRQEYAINSGTFINNGTLSLGADAILFVGV
jgi:hypothetical protein